MRYHNITKDDMLNGDGLRVVLWVAGCEHHCKGCQNQVTWDPDDGIEFTVEDLEEIIKELRKDYVSGLTISGGDPLYIKNRAVVGLTCEYLKKLFPDKTIWIYTGYYWEEINDLKMIKDIDVLVDGPFIEEMADINYHWAGSTNQRTIDVQQSLKKGEIILWDGQYKSKRNGNKENGMQFSRPACDI